MSEEIVLESVDFVVKNLNNLFIFHSSVVRLVGVKCDKEDIYYIVSEAWPHQNKNGMFNIPVAYPLISLKGKLRNTEYDRLDTNLENSGCTSVNNIILMTDDGIEKRYYPYG